MGRPEAPMDKPLLAAVLCRHPLQRYAATSDEALHSYPATRFGRNPSPVSIHPTIGSDLTVGNFASAGLMARTCTKALQAVRAQRCFEVERPCGIV